MKRGGTICIPDPKNVAKSCSDKRISIYMMQIIISPLQDQMIYHTIYFQKGLENREGIGINIWIFLDKKSRKTKKPAKIT